MIGQDSSSLLGLRPCEGLPLVDRIEVTKRVLVGAADDDLAKSAAKEGAAIQVLVRDAVDNVMAAEVSGLDDVSDVQVAAGEGGGVLNHESIVEAPGGQLKQIERAPGGADFPPPEALSGFVFVSSALRELDSLQRRESV